uniref:Kinesin light chain n=1 Tax=Eptatretus burgeri TaxID=7764 RepID=A0A8C4QYL9_EPTBU
MAMACSDRLTQEEILTATRSTIQGLETLRGEHQSLLLSLCGTTNNVNVVGDCVNIGLINEKSAILQHSIDSIELGLNEAEVILALANHLGSVEAEKQKLRAQVRRLCQENGWLREELAGTQQRLQQSEQALAQLEEETSHLRFMASLRRYDEGNSSTVSSATPFVIYSMKIVSTWPLPFFPYHVGPMLKLFFLVLGKDQPDVAKQLNNLALLCLNQSKFPEVEHYYKRALDIYEAQLTSDDPNVAKTKNNLASCYLKQGKYKEAEILYKEVLTSMHEKTFGNIEGENQPIWMHAEERELNKVGCATSMKQTTTLRNLSALYKRQGKMEAANILDACTSRSRKVKPLMERCLELKQRHIMEMRASASAMSSSFEKSRSFSKINLSHLQGGNLKRSGSFSRLRASIRRSSEKLMMRLKGGGGRETCGKNNW